VIERLIGIAAVGPDWVLWLLLAHVAAVDRHDHRALWSIFRRRRLRFVPFSRTLEAALRTETSRRARLLQKTRGPEASSCCARSIGSTTAPKR
jgi:hypothetical protein